MFNRFLIIAMVMAAFAGFASAEKVRVGLGYIPDVQFAPFYAGVVEGIYKHAGLEVEFQHGYASELYPLLATGKLDFVVADAEDVILLRTSNPTATPLKYVLAFYQSVPNGLFSLKQTNIKFIADLKGKTIGMPGMFGTSLTSLQAILRKAGLTEKDVNIQQIGFTQAEAVTSKRVDVAMGYVNNEPVFLRKKGIALNIIPASPYYLSAGNGVITTDSVLKNTTLVKSFVQATQRAMVFTLKTPKKAFEDSKKYVPNLSQDRYAVLQASLRLYQSAYSKNKGIGFSNPVAWSSTLKLLKQTDRVKTNLAPTIFYSNQFLDSSIKGK